jgi:ATP-binding cassette, subfamily B, multidrug efflux pump
MFGGPGAMRSLMERDNIKTKNVSQTLARFGRYFRPYWLILILVLVVVVFSTWAQVYTPRLTGQVVDCYLTPGAAAFAAQSFLPGIQQPEEGKLQGNEQPPDSLNNLSSSAEANCWYINNSADLTQQERLQGLGLLTLKIAALFTLSAAASGLAFYLMTWTGQNVLRNIRTELFKHLHQLSIGYYTRHEAGDLMSRITNDTEALQQVFNFALVSVFSGSLLIAWIGYSMFAESAGYALLSLAVVPLMILATIWFSNQARKAFRLARREIGNVNAELQENIAAVREVQAFSREAENIASFRAANASNRDANVRAVAYTSGLNPTLEALGYLAMAIVTITGGLLVLRGQTLFGTTVSLGLVITFLAYVQRFNQPIQQISILWTNIQNAIAGGERIFGLLDTVPDLQDDLRAIEMPEIVGKVEFKNVSAGYDEGEHVLCGVSFTAEPGQTIAIVGPTGAGKTTLINLIPRFYDVKEGEVLIDGIDICSVTGESLRSQIGIVLQDNFLFSATIMENIRFGRPEASDEEVFAAARLANADSFIERLPDGYQTVLGERGSGLSQGQRQLLAIARAALAEPRILILDEATSSVDTRTERLIQKALEHLLAGRTSFVIAHRLSTIRNADTLLVLKDGIIIERGKHEELLAQKSFYNDLYMSQFRREELALPDTTALVSNVGMVEEHSTD